MENAKLLDHCRARGWPFWATEDGRVLLVNADCLDVLPTLEPGSVDAVVTDPPYGMAYQSGRRQVRYGMIANDDDAELLSWTCDWARRNARHSAYVFCRWDNIPDVSTPDGFVTWVKNNHTSGDLDHAHARMTEGIVFYRGETHFFPNGRPRDVVFCERESCDLHPTQKPVKLMREVVSWTSGEVVDPFMRSGSTAVAAIQSGRRFVGIEMHGPYFDKALQRIKAELERAPLFEPKPRYVTKPLLTE